MRYNLLAIHATRCVANLTTQIYWKLMMTKPRKPNAMARLAELLTEAVDSGSITVAEIVERSGVERSLVYKYKEQKLPGCTVDTLERLLGAIGAHMCFPSGEPKKSSAALISTLERALRLARSET